jgi:glycosyltransferase involved in cell wall biosynthesis
MRIDYIANVRMPTEKAHGVQIMKMCEAWGKNNKVTLFAPTRFNHIKADSFEYYSVEKNFKIKKILSFDLLSLGNILGKLAFWVQNISFAVFTLFAVLLKKNDIIFSRDFWSAYFLSLLGEKVVYEIHDSPNRHFITRHAFKKIDKFVVTNNYKAEELTKYFGVPQEKILVVPNGVDVGFFSDVESKAFSRRLVGLPQDKKIVLYSGHLYSWKGADILLEAAKKMPKNVIAVFVGGIAQDIERFKTMANGNDNILILGHQEYKKIPYYLASSDILVLPNTAKERISLKETSPIKLFEYMAAGRPIVASDIPSIREIASEEEVVFFRPDDASDLAAKISMILSDYNSYLQMAQGTKKAAHRYSWNSRAAAIFNFIQN